jgi:hypothetical protein
MPEPDGDRAELERGLRAAHLAIAELRADLHHLAAQVVALIDATGHDAAVDAAAAGVLAQIEQAIEREDGVARLHLGTVPDKYAVATAGGPPCAELLPLCGARCCTLPVALTTQDLDEGVIRWDYARPYLIRHAAGRCVHHDAATGGCTEYAARPATCRSYDCRADPRIWSDYAARIPAPPEATARDPRPIDPAALVERARARRLALATEASALRSRDLDRERGD